MAVQDMSEADWEAFALDTLGELAWQWRPGTAIAPGSGQRDSWSALALPVRLREAVARINPQLPDSAVDEAASILLTPPAGTRSPKTTGYTGC